MRFLDIFRASKIKAENEQLHQQIKEMQDKMDSLGITEYIQASEKFVPRKKSLTTMLNKRTKKLRMIIPRSVNYRRKSPLFPKNWKS